MFVVTDDFWITNRCHTVGLRKRNAVPCASPVGMLLDHAAESEG